MFSEVPNNISLCYSITGCNIHCHWCHSKELWNKLNWKELTEELLLGDLKQYKGLVTCILFFWWEWEEDILCKYLELAKSYGYKTCLYTWRELEDLSNNIINKLNYIKVWPYKEECWWLDSSTTNQKFINLENWQNLNSYFLKTKK